MEKVDYDYYRSRLRNSLAYNHRNPQASKPKVYVFLEDLSELLDLYDKYRTVDPDAASFQQVLGGTVD